jgi:hypothetical protein
MPFKNRILQNESQKKYWSSNKQYYLEKKEAHRELIREKIREIKSVSKCMNCPENHPACLVFHHKDPSQKDGEIGMAVSKGWSMEKLLEEISKCEVLCANCHMKLHDQTVAG